MPRGNLEVISPRALVLGAAHLLLNAKKYKEVCYFKTFFLSLLSLFPTPLFLMSLYHLRVLYEALYFILCIHLLRRVCMIIISN